MESNHNHHSFVSIQSAIYAYLFGLKSSKPIAPPSIPLNLNRERLLWFRLLILSVEKKENTSFVLNFGMNFALGMNFKAVEKKLRKRGFFR